MVTDRGHSIAIVYLVGAVPFFVMAFASAAIGAGKLAAFFMLFSLPCWIGFVAAWKSSRWVYFDREKFRLVDKFFVGEKHITEGAIEDLSIVKQDVIYEFRWVTRLSGLVLYHLDDPILVLCATKKSSGLKKYQSELPVQLACRRDPLPIVVGVLPLVF